MESNVAQDGLQLTRLKKKDDLELLIMLPLPPPPYTHRAENTGIHAQRAENKGI